MEQPLVYQIAFASMRGMTRTLASDLLGRLGSEQAFFAATESTLRYITGSRSRIYTDAFRADLLARARAEAGFIGANGVRAIYHTDADYPATLAQCDDAPLMLYGLGDTNLNDCRMLGVVGTRHATPYGLDFTAGLIGELSAMVSGLVVVSGLAYGIDVAAHRAALRCGVPTVAVLAHGLHTVYPAEHRQVAVEMIRKGGMLLSDYRSDEPVHKGNFVARNRIVAGMSHALLVVESADRGGALITAGLAADYGRDVFAVPGRITDPYSAGCNRLLACNAATLVRSASDICSAMGWPVKTAEAPAEPTLPLPLNLEEELIVKYLNSCDDAMLAQITAGTGIGVGRLMSLLIDMEFRGLILSLPGGRYRALL